VSNPRAFGRRCAIIVTLLLGCLSLSANSASGLFNLELLAQHRSGIEPIRAAAEQALPSLTRGTSLANHWAVNPAVADLSDVRLILFRSDAETDANEVTGAFTDGCQTSIPIKLIICDVRVFEELMHRWGFDRITDLGDRDWPVDADVPVRTRSPAEQAPILLQMVTWVLGHEIGHLSVKSTDRAADVNSFLSDAPARRLTQTTEVLADQHVFHGSGLSDAERGDLSGFLVAALNAELHLKYCPARDVVQMCGKIPAGVGIIFDYNSPNGLDIDASKSHPEFLLRLVRLRELSETPEQCQMDGICVLLKEVLDRVQAFDKS
jgi:hypothetical protein